MKKLLSLLFCLTVNSAFAQQYFPFPTTTATWTYQYYDDFHNPTSNFTCYEMRGDTTIGLYNYKIISGGALRESNKIIYFIPFDSIQEYVLYDFNLHTGDTLYNPFGGNVINPDTVIVMGEDSVLLQNGYHRRLHLNSFAHWIEGIGSFNYLLSPTLNLPLSGNDELACFANDTAFIIPGSYCCVTGIEETIREETFLIYPNPTSGKFIIQTYGQKINQITITAISGQNIFKKDYSNNFNQAIEINLTHQSKGIYLMQAVMEKQVVNQKIIVE